MPFIATDGTVCPTQNSLDIYENGGRPFVNYALPTLTYATVFPGRVNPLDDPATLATYLAFRRDERRDFFTHVSKAA